MQDLAAPKHWNGRCRECGGPHRPPEGSFSVCHRCYRDPRSYYRLISRAEARRAWMATTSASRLETLLRELPHVKRTPRGAFLYHECDVTAMMTRAGRRGPQ